jgi:hypothetical protein
LWYSPVLFARPWIRLMGRSEEEMRAAVDKKALPHMYLAVFLCGFLIAFVMAGIFFRYGTRSALDGAMLGALCWLGFAAPTSYATALFSLQPRALWLINSAYNLVSFAIAGAILAVWH